MTANARLAGETLAHLAGLGVRDFVVCAGARNAPLVTSLLSVVKEEDLKVYHHFDERCAAFFAIGLSRSSGKPAVVLTTSGTAVAELHPAMIEAYYSGIPLIAVTADRPPTFRGSGAPQAIEQVGIFGPYAPVALDVSSPTDLGAVVAWNRCEPLHLNVCFEEPTKECRIESLPDIPFPNPKQPASTDDPPGLEGFLAPLDGLVVILGELPEDWREDVLSFLVRSGAPVWAEATSGLRESQVLRRQLLQTEKDLAALNMSKVLRIGGVPSLRFWRDLESRLEIEVMSVTKRLFSGLARESRNLVLPNFPPFPEWKPIGKAPDAPARSDLETLLEKHSKSEVAMMRKISEWIDERARVFLGNSLPVREWNLAASIDPAHPDCHANRGANGIDGEVATFLGLSEGGKESWGIFGDLTALYDLNAPSLLSQLGEGRRRIVILNNGGGKIFSRLPGMAALSGPEKQVTENHHATGFQSWAEMWGMEYRKWEAGDDAPALPSGDTVVEVFPDNEASEKFWADWK